MTLEDKLIKLGVDPVVAAILVAAGLETPAKIKAAKDVDLKAKEIGLKTGEVSALRSRFGPERE
jgi:hypothetical protein